MTKGQLTRWQQGRICHVSPLFKAVNVSWHLTHSYQTEKDVLHEVYLSELRRQRERGRKWRLHLLIFEASLRGRLERLEAERGMASSGMLRRVPLVRTDVPEELSASIIRVTGSVVPSSTILVTLMKEALSSSQTSVLTRATRRILHSHRRENLKSLK
jgi:hypothetical protein